MIGQDADPEYDPQEYPRSLKPLHKGKADLVSGLRFMGAAAHGVACFGHVADNRSLAPHLNMCSNFSLTIRSVWHGGLGVRAILPVRGPW